jgi:hypothetical protein
VTTIIDQSTKSHRVENIVYWPYSSNFAAATTTTHHATMMSLLGGHKEGTILAWRLPR